MICGQLSDKPLEIEFKQVGFNMVVESTHSTEASLVKEAAEVADEEGDHEDAEFKRNVSIRRGANSLCLDSGSLLLRGSTWLRDSSSC